MLFRIHSNFKFLIYFNQIAGVPGTAASPPPRWRSPHSAEMGCVWLQLCQVKMSRTPYKMIIAENFCRRYWSSMYFQSEHLLLYFFICRSKITKITVSSNLITPCQGSLNCVAFAADHNQLDIWHTCLLSGQLLSIQLKM